MNVPPDLVEMHATHVVGICLGVRQSPADVMAESGMLRRESDELRAAVVQLVVRTLGSVARLEFVLSGLLREGNISTRAQQLVRATLVFDGEREFEELPSRQQMLATIDAIEDDTQRRAVRHSVPIWLVPPMVEAFGDDVDAALAALSERAPRTLRANLLRVASRDELSGRLREEGIETVLADHADTALHVRGTRNLFRTKAFTDGCFEQQDEASQLCALAVAPPPGGRVLDLCCGSGGKTLALAGLMSNRGSILATDIHEGRVKELKKRIARAGTDNVQPHLLVDGVGADETLATFAARADRILIDAPCSGTGSWRRRPEARMFIEPSDIEDMQATQAALLERAVSWLRDGARIVYATCSVLRDENERQVEALLERHPELECVRLVEILGKKTAGPITDDSGTFLSLRPDRHGTDGFFAAVLRRKRSV